MSLIAELKRRNVIRAAGLYLVGSWLLVQVAGTILPMFGAPDWIARSLVLLLAIGFVPALVVAWVFELTPSGLRRDEDVPVAQSIAPNIGVEARVYVRNTPTGPAPRRRKGAEPVCQTARPGCGVWRSSAAVSVTSGQHVRTDCAGVGTRLTSLKIKAALDRPALRASAVAGSLHRQLTATWRLA